MSFTLSRLPTVAVRSSLAAPSAAAAIPLSNSRCPRAFSALPPYARLGLGLPACNATTRRNLTSTPRCLSQTPASNARPSSASKDTAVATAGATPTSLGDRVSGYVQKTKTMVKQLISGTKVYLAETRQAKELKRKQAVEGYVWNRREYFLVKRNEQDFWRAIPFLFCCVFLGEAIPFLLLRGIVPSPCLTPEQVAAKVKRLTGIRKELSASLIQSIEAGDAISSRSFLTDDFVHRLANTQPQYFEIANMTGTQLRMYNKYLGIWRVGPAPYLRRVISMHAEYIKGDDQLLVKEGVDKLSASELQAALDARGLPSMDIPLPQMQADLNGWAHLHAGAAAVPFGLIFMTGIVRTGTQGRFADVRASESAQELAIEKQAAAA
ncbi:hypothetical protein HDU89_000573 [Geranomyces variabilis]|nr:hypothetical protein HDU89_000573 [Geranomyces variabilis]